jgi:Uma2 family endonuclease
MSQVALRPLTREEFHRAIDAGVYPDFERLELLDGQVYKRMTNHPPHAGTILSVSEWLRASVPSGSMVRVLLPVALGERSEPEPDVSVVVGRPRDFMVEHPLPEQITLIVEVSDSSLNVDLRVKLPLYAQAGIAEYWVIDLRRRRILVHREPEGSSYRAVTTHGIRDCLDVSWRRGESVAVRDLLP